MQNIEDIATFIEAMGELNKQYQEHFNDELDLIFFDPLYVFNFSVKEMRTIYVEAQDEVMETIETNEGTIGLSNSTLTGDEIF